MYAISSQPKYVDKKGKEITACMLHQYIFPDIDLPTPLTQELVFYMNLAIDHGISYDTSDIYVSAIRCCANQLHIHLNVLQLEKIDTVKPEQNASHFANNIQSPASGVGGL